MQKTKLGISVGLLGAALYFLGIFSGYLVPVLLAGYILLCEENEWLRKAAVKAISVMVAFSLMSTVVSLIPNFMNFIGYLVSMFGGSFYIAILSNLVSAVVTALNILETLLLLGLGIKALNQGTIAVPVVDKLINKYMG